MDETQDLARKFQTENMQVLVYKDRQTLGTAAGKTVALRIKELQTLQNRVNIVFAAAPSQNEFLATLRDEAGIDWSRINAFHLDEYVGMAATAPQSFRNYLKGHLFSRVQPGQVFLINGDGIDLKTECLRYRQLLIDYPLDIACIGIGENGHLAFNDPPVADFLDPYLIKIVDLDERCRQQQVNDGCFSKLGEVPRQALTLTIPTILTARNIYCMVPGSTKAEAIQQVITGAITPECPASILRRHMRTVLFLDQLSAGLI